ncbi:ribosome biogenesis GTPase YlqF [Corallincola spongiicola]|uniref:Ribosome biogenesis GTPase A n=1 Tax=Corallincola spongiicola TaxID=2520508 RepID=A0ABY1WRN6_9GAMM|nr:ribosome biogenesis GTPase YlqF [Corallincola spongiicola]TAA47396.1 ribosome biogenesis GTPase YlqF [Corallincola spongiicola]
MAIQWYPGHMHKAQKEIAEVMPQMDLIIEVLDARIPYSSSNPMITKLRGDKPVIKVLNKRDLADPLLTARWVDYLEQETGVRALPLTTQQPSEIKTIIELCRKLVPHRDQAGKNIRAMIMGIPNVGKSTTINILADRIIAKTGNEPAVTKAQQRINLQNGVVLTDTPGMLWPKVENENSGYRLAVTGAVKDTAMESDDVGMYAADYLLLAYPEQLKQRYQLSELPETGWDLLEMIGRKRGCLRSGGKVEMNKAADLLLHEVRAGTLGKITMETPDMVIDEEALIAKRLAEKAAKDAQRKAKFKGRR